MNEAFEVTTKAEHAAIADSAKCSNVWSLASLLSLIVKWELPMRPSTFGPFRPQTKEALTTD